MVVKNFGSNDKVSPTQNWKGMNQTNTGIKTRYNFRADYNCGIGKIACRRIPCLCHSCQAQLKKE